MAAAREYDVLVSESGQDWTTVVSISVSDGSYGETPTLAFELVKAKYIKVRAGNVSPIRDTLFGKYRSGSL